MRHGLRACGALAVVLWYGAAWAQATATPTLTPTVTATATATTRLPVAPPAPRGDTGTITTLLRNVTAATGRTGATCAFVGYWPHVALQVTRDSGSCTALTVTVTGTVDGLNYAPIPISGGATDVTEADLVTSATRVWMVPAGFRWVCAAATTVTDCTASVVIGVSQ